MAAWGIKSPILGLREKTVVILGRLTGVDRVEGVGVKWEPRMKSLNANEKGE